MMNDEMRKALNDWATETNQSENLTIAAFEKLVEVACRVAEDAQPLPSGTVDLNVKSAAKLLIEFAPEYAVAAAMIGARPEPVIIHKGNALEFWHGALNLLSGR